MSQNAGKALNFDGSNDYVSIDTNFNISGGMSVELWFKTTTTTASAIFGQSKLLPTVNPSSFVPTLAITSSGTLRAEYWTGTLGAITTTFAVNDGKWHHVAFTTSIDTQTLYVDGVLIGNRAGTLLQTWWHYTQIGTGYDAGTRLGGSAAWRYCAADVDDVRVWDTILPLSVVKDWMFQPLNSTHPFYSSLRGYYKLNEGSGTTAYDSSSYSFHGSLKNFGSTPWLASYVPKISVPTIFKKDAAATWPAKNSSSSSIMTINASMSGNTYIVYTNNGNSLTYNSVNKPSYMIKRISRIWRTEKEGSVSGEIIFDYSNLDTSGFNTFKLLISNDTNFLNASYVNGSKIGSKKIRFSNITIQDSGFYTIGAYDFQAPTVQTSSIDEIKAFSAKVTGKVLDDGGKTTTRGMVWSLLANPDTSLSTKITSGTGNGVFQVILSGLTSNTTYHVRAFAYNSIGIAYGADSTFTTPVASLPTVVTKACLNIYVDSVLCAGEVISDGNVTLTDRGLVWSTSQNPTIALSTKISLGNTIGSFNSIIKSLIRGTTYHFRAYATSALGTAYGGDSIFITAGPPTVKINNISSISYYSATIGSEVTYSGQLPVLAKGICWSVNANPDLKNASNSLYGSGMGKYNINITNLNPNTVYHIRAYAINDADTAYSADSIFKTLKTSPPTVATSSVVNITDISAICGGDVQKDGGSFVLQKGVCWSTSLHPTATLTSKTNDGNNLGIFTSNINGLTRGTLYHVRAYAINAYDTSYGGDSTFTTLDAPKVTTDVVTNIIDNSANSGGTVLSDGGVVVIKRGICWNTFQNPTIKNSDFTTDGYGTGHFNSTLSFLTAGTKYYVRAYAINAIDTSYGNEVTFTTPSAPVVTTTPATAISGKSALSGGNVISGDSVTARGVVWSKFPNPTVFLTTKTNDGTGLGTFTSNITSLTPKTKYYYKAYATNKVGTSYGDEFNFTTADKAVVNTATAVVVSSGTVQCGGNVVSDGGMIVTQRGCCWDVKTMPKANGNKTNDGNGTGVFVSLITGLNPNTNYYIRAYAINGVDTSYGEEKRIKITPPTVKTGSNDNITIGEAEIYGTLNANGQMTNITFEYGLTTSYGNTIAANPANSGDTIEINVSAHLSGLTHNTTYYYRLAGESNHGKIYGNDSVFTTLFNTSVNELNTDGKFIISSQNNYLLISIIDHQLGNVNALIFDMYGQLINSFNINKEVMIYLPQTSAFYLIKLNYEGGYTTFKVLIK